MYVLAAAPISEPHFVRGPIIEPLSVPVWWFESCVGQLLCPAVVSPTHDCFILFLGLLLPRHEVPNGGGGGGGVGWGGGGGGGKGDLCGVK